MPGHPLRRCVPHRWLDFGVVVKEVRVGLFLGAALPRARLALVLVGWAGAGGGCRRGRHVHGLRSLLLLAPLQDAAQVELGHRRPATCSTCAYKATALEGAGSSVPRERATHSASSAGPRGGEDGAGAGSGCGAAWDRRSAARFRLKPNRGGAGPARSLRGCKEGAGVGKLLSKDLLAQFSRPRLNPGRCHAAALHTRTALRVPVQASTPLVPALLVP
jgi:hypothetical protein